MTANSNTTFYGPSGNILGNPAMVFIQSQSFVNQPNVMFNTGFSSDFDEYVFKIINVEQTAASGLLSMRVSTNSGVSVDTGSNYKNGGFGKWIEGVFELANQTYTSWPVSVDMGDDIAYGSSGTVSIITPGAVNGNNVHSQYTSTVTRADSGLSTAVTVYGGQYIGAPGVRINAVQFLNSTASSNFTGKIALYGIRNS